jgi:hypothetical protein
MDGFFHCFAIGISDRSGPKGSFPLFAIELILASIQRIIILFSKDSNFKNFRFFKNTVSINQLMLVKREQ